MRVARHRGSPVAKMPPGLGLSILRNAVPSAHFVHRTRRAPAPIVSALLVVLVLIGGAATGWSQNLRGQPSLGLQEQGAPPPPPVAIEPQQSPPPARQDSPGLLQEMRKLVDKILPAKK